MNDSPAPFLAIEIGGTKLQIVAGDSAGRITRRWRAAADRERGGPGICDQLRAGLAEIRAGLSPRAVGVGFGGPIDFRTGRIARSHQIHGWEGFELKPWLEQQTGLPVATENDANTAALAEAVAGAGAGASPVFYFNLGSGVGGGIVIDSNIFHGLPPGEAEFGHLRLDRTGATVESRCSGWAVDRRIRATADVQPNGLLARLLDPTHGGEAKRLAAALAQHDPTAQTILAELADDLGFALSHVVHLIHPSLIVMGGGLSLIGDPLRGAVADALPRHVMEALHPVPPVRLAKLGEDAVPAGALILASRL
ncbi:MAG TPA: ROK family protein [Tepidisphaeraceae bacterium]|jgi:glucokinase